MIALFHDGSGRVYRTHYKPERLPEEEREKAFLVEQLPPEPDPQFGKASVLYVNPDTGDVWWEMENRPLTLEEKIELMYTDFQETKLVQYDALATIFEEILLLQDKLNGGGTND